MRKPENARIREIDGRSFYALVTGHEDALDQLHVAIPNVLANLKLTGNGFSETDLKELRDYFCRAYL